MKTLIGLVLTLSKISFCYSQSSDQFLRIENISFSTSYFDRIEILRDTLEGPGSFHRVNFIKGKNIVYIFEDVLDSISHAFNVPNLVRSEYVLVSKLSQSYIVSLFGFQFGCCPRKLTIIECGPKGFKKIFDDEFDLWNASKLDSHTLLINGRPVLPQAIRVIDSLNILVSGYAPHLIYQLKEKLELDTARTIQWNENNYVFRGLSGDQDIWVAEPSWRSKKKLKPYVYKEKSVKPK